MEFRPCIDIHNGKVKQIVGGSLRDAGNRAEENFVAEQDAGFFAHLYKEDGIAGGHIILLNARDSAYYEETKKQALFALREYPGGLQAGGGITPENAEEFLRAGRSLKKRGSRRRFWTNCAGTAMNFSCTPWMWRGEHPALRSRWYSFWATGEKSRSPTREASAALRI